VNNVFDSDDRQFPLDIELSMLGASLNEQESVPKGVHHVNGMEDLLKNIFFEK
jgi:hypothetical protein